ncbi:multidrug efflux SMR transporter [Erwinia sp. P6884]|uniref:DMT family transporter n=1 Tax=Erwinia sp. P6884 TaxID=3141450 RepID=UPI0031863541
MRNDKYSWFLGFAIMAEIIATILLGLSSGMTKLLPTAGSLAAYVCSYYFLTLALKRIPLGLAYALWAGVGIMGNSLINVLLLGTVIHRGSIAGMLLIVAGALIINLLADKERSRAAQSVGEKAS